MDRPIIYTQEQGRSVDFLFAQRATMIGLAKLAQAALGSSTVVNGLAVTPNSPAALNVLVGIGEIYTMAQVDATTWGSLPADTTDTVLKQGLNMSAQTIATPAPSTSGYSIAYLIEAQYQDSDTNPAVLPFFNSSNPQVPLNGQGGNGAALPTQRQGLCVIQAKAGIAAATGTQVTPSVDSGWTALAVVTVANGQSTVTSGNITAYPGAPVLSASLLAQIQNRALLNGDSTQVFNVAPATAASNAVQFSQVSGVVGSARNLKMVVSTASASATVTADEIIVETALGGLRYCLAPYSQTINLATTGAGGMDTGSAPASGFVALYAIYGASVGQSIVATNATSGVAPSIYAGGHMPSNFTASALIGVYPTNPSGQFLAGYQIDRTVYIAPITALSTSTQQASFTSLSIASSVPPNAKTACGYMVVSTNGTGACVGQIAGTSLAIGSQQVDGYNNAGGAFSVPIITLQTIYYVATIGGAGTMSATISITSYTF